MGFNMAAAMAYVTTEAGGTPARRSSLITGNPQRAHGKQRSQEDGPNHSAHPSPPKTRTIEAAVANGYWRPCANAHTTTGPPLPAMLGSMVLVFGKCLQETKTLRDMVYGRRDVSG